MNAPSTAWETAVPAALRVAGTYVGAGRPRFCKAELACVPMTDAHEYASVSLFEQPQAAPVLVSPTQRCAILTGVVRELRAEVPGLSFIGVRMYGPDFDVQMSAELLAPDVLVAHAPLQLLPAMRRAGRRNIAIVQQDLRADGLEQGRNEFAVWLVEPTAEAVEGFQRFVDRSAFLQGLSGLSVAPVADSALGALA
ncbi:hypothetical protein [Ideonella sp.]|uniref:hypothetical protein n=1 Tax=Ideonella sp. TaxID=1929293 RepID=UPI0035AE13C7